MPEAAAALAAAATSNRRSGAVAGGCELASVGREAKVVFVAGKAATPPAADTKVSASATAATDAAVRLHVVRGGIGLCLHPIGGGGPAF